MYDPMEAMCIAFHQTWQRWAPVYGQPESGIAWQDMPASYRKLLKQVFRDMVDKGDVSMNHWNG